jgi:short-subunit dehydrogenase
LVAALITGASRGIGAAAARRFADHGFDLLLVARPSQDFADLAAQLCTPGRRIEIAEVDLGEPAAIPPALDDLCGRGLTPTVLINNAGAAWTGPLTAMPLEQWQALMQLNLTSVFQICSNVIPRMRPEGGGIIINVSSHACRNAFTDWGAYSASKAALATYSRCLAAEERVHGIRVSTLTLGSVNTPLWDSKTVHSDFDRRAMLAPERVADALLHLALQPSDQVIEDLTLMPAAGAF